MITTSELRRAKRFTFEETPSEPEIKAPKMDPLVYIGLYAAIQSDYQTFGTENIPDRITRLVCVRFGFEFEEISNRSHKRELVIPRQICIYLLCKMTKMTLTAIGKMFHRDHSTIIYSKDTVQDLMDTDKKFRIVVEEIEYQVQRKQ